jgi:hypothetical protein
MLLGFISAVVHDAMLFSVVVLATLCDELSITPTQHLSTNTEAAEFQLVLASLVPSSHSRRPSMLFGFWHYHANTPHNPRTLGLP